MHNNRIEQLLSFLEEEPSDAFLLYTLALEYENIGDIQAENYYDAVLEKHPEYLATYYRAAAYFQVKQPLKAEMLYKIGIKLALTQGKTKTYQELKNALAVWKDDLEE